MLTHQPFKSRAGRRQTASRRVTTLGKHDASYSAECGSLGLSHSPSHSHWLSSLRLCLYLTPSPFAPPLSLSLSLPPALPLSWWHHRAVAGMLSVYVHCCSFLEHGADSQKLQDSLSLSLISTLLCCLHREERWPPTFLAALVREVFFPFIFLIHCVSWFIE